MEKVRRNERCPCGSGRKFKKCCLNKKPRSKTLRLNFPVKELPRRLIFNESGFQLILDDGTAQKPSGAYLDSYYDRDRKRKILNRVRLHSPLANIRTSLNEQLARYQHLIAVDTNTINLSEGTLSVSAVVLVLYKERSAAEIRAEVSISCLIEVRDLEPRVAERYGLLRVLQILEIDPKFQQGKTGVIIDHNLDDLESLNSREKPIMDEYYLPSNAELIFATSDSGVESAPNKLIRNCDKWASEFVAHLKESPELLAGNHLLVDDKGNRYCMWTCPETEFDNNLPSLSFD